MRKFSKIKILNKLTIIATLLLLAVLLTYASPFLKAVNEVYASNAIINVDDGTNLKMTFGASVRTQSQEDSGLRFQVEYKKSYVDDLKRKIGSEYETVSFGSFIVPNDYKNRYGITHQGLTGKSIIDINITSFLSDSSDGWYKACVSITNIKSQNFDRLFMSRHYVKLVHKNGDIEYVYAPLTTEPRSVFEVAKSAFSDRASSIQGKYTYDTSKNGNYRYSQYSGAQLSIIKSFIDAVVILDKTTKTYGGGLDSALYTPAYSVNSDKITSTNKIAKMYWSDGSKISGTINGNSAKYVVSSTSRPVGDVYSYSFNIIGGNDVMPIAGNGLRFYDDAKIEEHLYGNAWTNDGYGGYEAQLNYWLPEYKKLGINVIYDDTPYGDTIKYVVKGHLSAAEKYNIGLMIWEYDLNEYSYGTEKTQAQLNAINDRMNELSEYESFVLYGLRDEPKSKQHINYMANARNSLLSGCGSLMSNKGFLANILPYNPYNELNYNADFGKSPSLDAYRNYIDYLVQNVDPKFLSYDMYPFRLYTNDNGSTESDNIDIAGYFSNLSVIREKANQYHIPFWSYIQCGTDWDDSGSGANMPSNSHLSRPTEGEFRWLVNTTLAYGAKGIEYFEAQQNEKFAKSQDGNPNYSRNGIWGANGQRNEWYDYALEANNQIKAIDEYLMNATQEGIIMGGSSYSSSYVPAGDKRNNYYELTSVSGNVMVGCFNYKGRTALYVVNDSTSGSNGSCTLNFNGNYTYTQIRKATKSTSIISGNQISLSGLQAGEGVLIVLD